MNRDKEPIISEIRPSVEDIEARERQLQAARKAQGSSAAKSRQSAVIPAASSPAKQTLAVIALVLVVGLAGAAAFLFMQLQQVQEKLTRSENIIQNQSENLAVLNNKLSVSGENANLSLDALKVIIKEQDTEIRKLWDLANKRNRVAITQNTEKITKLETSVAASSAKNEKNEKGLGDLAKRVTSTEAQLARLSEAELRLSQQAEKLRELDASLTKMKKSGLGTDAAEFRLQIEDLAIRIDRLQAVMGQ